MSWLYFIWILQLIWWIEVWVLMENMKFKLLNGSVYTVGAIIIWSLADFVGLPTYKEWNCV